MRPLDGGGDIFRRPVLQGDGQSFQYTPGGDVAAHDTGTDDVHTLRFKLLLLACGLQPFLQHEYPDQVPGGIRDDQAGDRFRFLFQQQLVIAAIFFP